MKKIDVFRSPIYVMEQIVFYLNNFLWKLTDMYRSKNLKKDNELLFVSVTFYVYQELVTQSVFIFKLNYTIRDKI